MLRRSALSASAPLAAMLAAIVAAGPGRAQTSAEAVPPPAVAPSPTAATAAPADQPPPVPVEPLVAQVRQALAEPARGNVDRGDRAALAAFYAERTGPALWVADGGLTPRARDAMAFIAKADDWGLSASAYELPQLAAGEISPAALADAEIKLGLAVLKYARHARGGRFDPSQISRNFDQKPALRDPKAVLEAMAGTEGASGYLKALHPRHEQFERLRQALIKARAGGNAPPKAPEAVVKVPDGPTIKPGMEHPHVALLRQRLKVAAAAGQESVYDAELQKAVRAFQQDNGMPANGIVTGRTRSALNGGPKAAAPAGTEVQRLLANMERWRWMPEELGEFYVWDNVPEFTARVVKKGQVIHSAKIIVGKVENQTPIFSASMRYVVFHPEWGVPDGIKLKEILPYLRPSSGDGFFGFFGGTDTRVLQRHNLRVSYNGRPVDASQVNWSQVDIRRFQFIQPAGPSNVLGVVKFRFPNKHDVYMHDTPQRELFQRTTRAFSHGCMRLENPGRLAEILLAEDKGWSAEKVKGMLAHGNNNEVELTKQIPVHVSYFTAMVGDDGQVKHFPDLYGHDTRVIAALSGRAMPPEPAANGDSDQPKQQRRTKRRPVNDDLW